jgi:hypothetical protein
MTARKIATKKRCTVCRHPNRTLIEAARVAGCSLDATAAKYGVSRDSIFRHMRHVPDDVRLQYITETPIRDLAARAATEGVTLLDHFTIVRGILLQQFQLAAAVGDRNATAMLAGKLIEVLREIGKVTGELSSFAVNSLTINNSTTILNSPIFASLQANLLQALAPFPAARSAVVTALRQMDEDNAPMKMIEHHKPAAEFATVKVADAPTINAGN